MGRRVSIFIWLVVLCPFTGQAQEKKITVADCQFVANPEEFLTRQHAFALASMSVPKTPPR